jgi:hypothetical protein
MRPMFPHPIDRYRLIEKLVRLARLTYSGRGIDQEALARRAFVSQATISNLEHLEKSLTSPKRRVRREDLVRVLCWGLELEPRRIDALLWLFDGESLTEDEERRYLRPVIGAGRESAVSAGAADPDRERELRDCVLAMLQEVLAHGFAADGTHTATVQVFRADERGELEEKRALFDLDQVPGQRHVVTELPASLTYPRDLLPYATLAPDDLDSAPARRELTELIERRNLVHTDQLARYGMRGIHCKVSIERYVRGEFESRMSLTDHRRHVLHWIGLLETYPDYEVGLADTTPDLELVISSTVRAMLRSARSDRKRIEPHRPGWGPEYVLWLDEVSALSFFLDFETNWRAIPIEDRTRSSVIGWLKGLVEE